MHAAASRQQFTPLKPAVELHENLMQNPRSMRKRTAKFALRTVWAARKVCEKTGTPVQKSGMLGTNTVQTQFQAPFNVAAGRRAFLTDR